MKIADSKFTFFFYLATIVLTVTTDKALACATCLCGDQTLTTLGNEKPFAGRTRLSVNALYREEEMGVAGFNQRKITEQRYTLGVGYWASDKLALSVRLPWSEKTLEDDNLVEQKTAAVGDAEIDTRYYLWSDGLARPRHLLGLQLGTRIPTAEKQTENGVTLDADVQSGAGLWIPSAGVWYGYYQFPWSLNAQIQANVGIGEGFHDYEFGKTLNSSITGQYALASGVGLQLGIDTRLSARNRYDGIEDDDSGGFIAYLAPGIVVSIAEDWLLHVKIQYAVIDDLNGEHDEDYVAYTGISYDF